MTKQPFLKDLRNPFSDLLLEANHWKSNTKSHEYYSSWNSSIIDLYKSKPKSLNLFWNIYRRTNMITQSVLLNQSTSHLSANISSDSDEALCDIINLTTRSLYGSLIPIFDTDLNDPLLIVDNKKEDIVHYNFCPIDIDPNYKIINESQSNLPYLNNYMFEDFEGRAFESIYDLRKECILDILGLQKLI